MKRKLLSIILTLCMVASLLPAVENTAAAADITSSESLGVVNGGADYDASTNPLAITSPEDLACLAKQVNAGGTISYTDSSHPSGSEATVIAGTASYQQTANIDLNAGYTFTFVPDTGLVAVNNGSTDVFYLGTGAYGTTTGSSSQFDDAASTAGGYYYLNAGTYTALAADDISADSDASTVTVTVGETGYPLNTWTPIGTGAKSFNGVFDGGSFTVDGIYLNNSSDNQGLFGYVNGGTVKDVGVVDSYIGCDITNSSYVGGIVGYSNGGTVEYCYNSSSVSGSYGVGGVVGYSKGGAVQYCCNRCCINGDACIGGVVGWSNNAIAYCYNSGNIGGDNCSDDIGGVAGYMSNDTLEYSYNSGSISGYDDVGGVAGFCSSWPSNCTIQYSYNSGSVSSKYDNNSHVGGITGCLYGTMQYTYNSGSISGNSGYIGGIVGELGSGSISSCYYDKQICSFGGINNGDTAGAAGKLTSEMVASSLNASLGTADIWTFAEEDLYPRLADPTGITFDMNETDAAYVSATPVFLSNSETCSNVTCDFTVGTENGVGWTSDDSSVIGISGSGAALTGSGTDIVLTASKGTAQKEVTVASVSVLDFTESSTTIESEKTYLIGSAAALQNLPTLVNGGQNCSGAVLRLSADIVLGDWQDQNSDGVMDAGEIFKTADGAAAYSSDNWIPIGISETYSFNGTFDGYGHTVSGIYLNNSSDFQGLFGFVASKGIIENIGVVNSYIHGGNGVGGVAGYSGGLIQNSYNSGTVSNSDSESSMLYVGGIVGAVEDSTVQYCYNTGKVIGNGMACTNNLFVGGIIGYRESGTVQYCYNSGSSRGNGSGGSTFTGGILGGNYGSIENCYNSGNVSGNDTGPCLGGICGNSNSGSFPNCYYDKQMCPLAYGVGSDDTSGTMGRFTDGMLGGLFADTTNWVTDANLYPRLAGMDGTDAALVSASPVTLAYTSDTDYETSDAVYTNFDLGAPENASGESVSWTSSDNSVVRISCGTASIIGSDSVTLTASLGSALKSVTLTVHDTTPPTLTAGSVSRTSNTAATVKFTSNEAGTYYYSVVEDGADAPTIETSEEGTACTAGETTITISTLTAGEQDVYVKVKDVTGNVSDALKIDIAAYVAHSTGSSSSFSNNNASIIINGESHTAGSYETTTGTDGRTVKTVTVDTDKLQTILDSQDMGATISIPVTGGSDIAAGILTGQSIKNMENDGATLAVQTDSATYTLPASEIDIDAIQDQFGTDVSLSDITVNVTIAEPSDETVAVVENAAEEGGYSIVVPAVEFNITCEYNGTTVEVSSFSSYVERLIAIPDGVDPNEITTAVVVHADGTSHQVPTEVALIDGAYYAKINSLTNSTYTVVYNPIEFSDVENHWAKDAINDMGSRMIVFGDENGNYNPDNAITRSEFATIMLRALGLAPGTGETGFSDVTATDWYCGYVETASEYGIITGYPNGAFGPNDTVTREQAMTMIARAMTITNLNADLTDGEAAQLLSTFSDGVSVSAYAKESIAACLKTGITSGTSNITISPKSEISRAEVAVMVKRLLQKSNLI